MPGQDSRRQPSPARSRGSPEPAGLAAGVLEMGLREGLPHAAECALDAIGARKIMPTAIDRDELRKLTDQGAQLVEVLPKDEYDWAHLPGAVNLPLKELDARTGQLDRSRPVIVYCHDSL